MINTILVKHGTFSQISKGEDYEDKNKIFLDDEAISGDSPIEILLLLLLFLLLLFLLSLLLWLLL